MSFHSSHYDKMSDDPSNNNNHALDHNQIKLNENSKINEKINDISKISNQRSESHNVTDEASSVDLDDSRL